jgi:hypothetical protein
MFDFSGHRTMIVGGKTIFLYNIHKDSELLPMNFEGIDEFFRTLDKLGKKAIGHAIILFDGYDDITTELYEIPEVRNFVKKMFERYPHLLNYINFDLEGHTYLLASITDVESLFVGEKLTIEEHIKRYGIHTPLPRVNLYINLPNGYLQHITEAMLEHGKKNRCEKYAERQVYKLDKIFRRAI